MKALLARLFAPQWAGGWTAMRLAYVAAALITIVPTARFIEDAYGAQDAVFSHPPLRLNDVYHPTLAEAWGWWGGAVLGLLALGWGGRLARPGLLLYLVCLWVYLGAEAMNTKAYHRLLTWEALALLFAPIGERTLTEKWRSPFARYVLLLVFMAMYGSTGWLKALHEPAWIDGSVLQHHLVDLHFGVKPLGAWVSGQRWLTAPMGWITVIFEAFFPLLILFRRLSLPTLLVGASFHVGIALMMEIDAFSWVALAAYPVLLHPEVAEGLYRRAQAWRDARRPA
jgi:hypothetical protein